MDQLAEFLNNPAFVYVVIVAAAGGLTGGILAAGKTSAPTSTIAGAVIGTIGSIIAGLMGAPEIVGVEGFDLVWAFGVGAIAAFVLGKSSG